MKNLKKLLFGIIILAAVMLLAACGENGMFKVPSFNVKFYDGETLIAEFDVRSAYLIKASKLKDVVAVPEGYALDGFYDSHGTAFSREFYLTKDTVFYARLSPLTYNITYDLGYGVKSDNPKTYTVETETFSLKDPYGQSSDLEFAGWTTAESATPEKTVTIPKGTTGDLFFKANFEDSNSFYLYFETFGGTEKGRLKSKTGTFTIPEEHPEKSGYNFVKWYIDENLTIPLAGDTYIATAKRSTVYAKYEIINYSATFIDADFPTINYTVETDDILVPDASRTGYTFTGYTYDSLTTPQKGFVIRKGTHRDYVFTAHYEINKYTISFETFGGTEVAAITEDYGKVISAPTDPKKDGCTFLGWYTDALCTNEYHFSTMPAGSFTLYAGWYSDDNYTLKYSVASGISADIAASRLSGSKVHAGDPVTLNAPAYAYGGVFRYWSRKISAFSSQVYSYDNNLSFAMPFSSIELVAEYDDVASFNYTLGGSDLIVSEKTLNKVFGNKISSDDYSGSSIKATYLDDLGTGDFVFETMTSDGNAPIVVRITGGKEDLNRIKLDYDVNYPSVTLLFDAKDGFEYEYKLNSSAFADCTSGMILPDFNKQRSGGNKVTVRRKDDTTNSIELQKSAYNAVNAAYYTKTFQYNGRTYDYVIEDYDECQAMMGYFATVYAPDANNRELYMGYAGGKATIKYYVEQNFRDEFSVNENDYVNFVIVKGSMPYYPAYENSFNKSTGIETVSYLLSTAQPNTQKSEQVESHPSDEQKLLSYISARPDTYEGFKINSFAVSQEIRSLYELESLAFGVKPVFSATTGQAYTVYEKAKQILRTIVDDGMNDYQKVSAIYDYLAMYVTYDHAVADMAGNNNVGFGQYSCFTSYGALVDGAAVCDGLSSAFRLMCAIEGIESEEYTGYSVSNGVGGHAWNKVKIGGNWYGVDATWCTTNINSGGSLTAYVHHRYCLVDESVLYASGHRERAEYKDDALIEYPVEDAAVGTFDYYGTVIYGTEDLTRTIRSKSEVTKLINHFKALGGSAVEVRVASKLSINELMMGTAATSSASIDEERKIYYIFF